MHRKIEVIKEDIADIKERCAPEWDAHIEYGQLEFQKLHMQKVEHRLRGGPWLGSKEGEKDYEYYDPDEHWRPIEKPQFHTIVVASDDIVKPPKASDTGHKFLDATLRDMTGV